MKEEIELTEVSKAIELLESLKGDSEITEEGITQIETTLGTLGKVFSELDPKAKRKVKIKVTIKFKPLQISIEVTF
jgi:hypothetical protein